MKTTISKRQLALCLIAGLSAGAAQATTWTYSSTGAVSAGGLSASASAYSATNNSTATMTATTAYYGGGLGVTSNGETTSSPQHAIDNNGPIETVMISFSDGVSGVTAADKVNLSSVTFGYVSGDSDFSVYAYTGSGTASPLGLTYSNLTSNGWTLVGQYNGGSSAATNPIANSIYSSYWLIGAYNGLGGSNVDSNDDFFKLASVTGSKCPTGSTSPYCGGGGTPGGGVPEPGTLLLMGAGFLGLTRVMRRR